MSVVPGILHMKILHTSDWHLGQSLFGYDRTEEFLDMFGQLERILREEQPDAMLVSGDIFDVPAPSSSAARMFKENLLRLARAVPSMTVVVTSGNHDSASRIDVDRSLWEVGGIHVMGTVDRRDGAYDFTRNTVVIPGKGIVVAVPFVNRAFMPPGTDDATPEQVFFAQASEAARSANPEGLPAVLMAHLTVTGCSTRGHRERVIGLLDSVDASVLGDGFDYVALGHIHHPQFVGSKRVRYSGSPLGMGFDEDYNHSVSVVEVRAAENPEVREIVIEPLRDLLTLPETPVPYKQALKILKKLDNAERAYIRLNVEKDITVPGELNQLALEAVRGKECRYCTALLTSAEPAQPRALREMLGVSDFREMTAHDIARRYFDLSGLPEETADAYLEMIDQLERELADHAAE